MLRELNLVYLAYKLQLLDPFNVKIHLFKFIISLCKHLHGRQKRPNPVFVEHV